MRATKCCVFGLASLLCTVNATKAPGKPVIAKRQAIVTVTNDGCTAVCVDLTLADLGNGTECDVYCNGGFSTSMPATSTSTSTSTSTLTATVTSTVMPTAKATSDGACHEVCEADWEQGNFDCEWACDVDFSTSMSATSTSEAALSPRIVSSAVDGDCTAVCWDLMPGTECDVQCASEFETETPGNSAHSSAATGFLYLASIFLAQIILEPSKAARIAKLDARENVQAQHVHEARLDRKFGSLDPRVIITRTVETTPIVSTITTYYAGNLNILPQAAEAPGLSAVRSQAAGAISAAQQALPSAASSALSEASASLSSLAATAPILANVTTVTLVSTGSGSTVSVTAPIVSVTAPVVSVTAIKTVTITPSTATETETVTEPTTEVETSTTSTTTSKKITKTKTTTTSSDEDTESTTSTETSTASITSSETSTVSTTSSETVTESTTTTDSSVVSETGFLFGSSVPETGSAPEYTVSTGVVLSILLGLAANVAFLI